MTEGNELNTFISGYVMHPLLPPPPHPTFSVGLSLFSCVSCEKPMGKIPQGYSSQPSMRIATHQGALFPIFIYSFIHSRQTEREHKHGERQREREKLTPS